ncbi:MAG: hypothetical protein ACREM2_07415 [Vulcanimicrobiaceae bacterium]
MIDWLRRVDPGFYDKEPRLLRAEAQIARYTEEAQARARLEVLRADRMLQIATASVALAAYIAATAGGTLDGRGHWPALWALAVLAVAGARALPWWPRAEGATWRGGLIGTALIAIPAAWTRVDPAVLGLALLTGATLWVARGRGRSVLLVLAVGVLFAARVPAQPIFAAPAAGILAACASVVAVRAIERVWRVRPQVATWSVFALLLVVCASTFAFDAPALAQRVPVEIAAIAIAYLGGCIVAVRIRRAELLARPGGVLSLPQSIVPLLDRSHHHAIICRIE